MFKSLGRFGTILSVGVGYYLVYLFLLTITTSIGSGRSYTQTSCWRLTPSGELYRFDLNDPHRASEAGSTDPEADTNIVPRAAAIYLPWPLMSNRFLWTERMACLSVTQTKQKALWIIVADPNQSTQFYLAIVDLPTQRVVGYLGKNGFQTHPPRGSETVTAKIDPSGLRLWAAGTSTWQDKTPGPFGRRGPEGPAGMICLSDDGLLEIDYLQRTVVKFQGFEKAWQIDPGIRQEKTNARYTANAVVIFKDHLVFDPFGRQESVRLPEKLEGKALTVCQLKNRQLVAQAGSSWAKNCTFTWFTEAGEITDEKQVENDPGFEQFMRESREQSARLSWGAVLIYPVPVVLTLLEGLQHWTGEPTDPRKNLIFSFLPILFSVALNGVLVEWLRRRWAMPRSWGCLLFAMIVGPLALITWLSTFRRNFAIDLAPPLRTGSEIFV